MRRAVRRWWLTLGGWLVTAPGPHDALRAPTLTLATWNLEWFMTPQTQRALTPACRAADAPRDTARRALPCDVAYGLTRSQEDIAALRRVARQLDADVIALQEVDGPEAAALLFPGHDFCFSSRVNVQNTGFAVRRGLPFVCGPEVRELSLQDHVRRGVELRLFPGSARELRLLSVHLKSGCAREPLRDSRPSCGQLRAQLPALARWMAAQTRARQPFAVLGDFNRDLRREPPGESVWSALRAPVPGGDAEALELVNTALGQPFQNCSPAQIFSGYIDYILLDRRMARGWRREWFGRRLFRLEDAVRRTMSDHCPVFVRIQVDAATSDLSPTQKSEKLGVAH